MTEADKRRFDAIAILSERSWTQFNERRQHEYRISVTYWTALAAAVAGSVTLPTPPVTRATLVGIVAAVVALHLIFLWGIWRGHGTDQRIAIHYQGLMQELAQAKFDPALADFVSGRSRQMGKLVHPNAVFQVGLTALLVLAFATVNWNRAG